MRLSRYAVSYLSLSLPASLLFILSGCGASKSHGISNNPRIFVVSNKRDNNNSNNRKSRNNSNNNQNNIMMPNPLLAGGGGGSGSGGHSGLGLSSSGGHPFLAVAHSSSGSSGRPQQGAHRRRGVPRGGGQGRQQPPAKSASWSFLRCTDVPQFDALQAAAHSFRYDDKLHLRILCNDSTRCAGLSATHNSCGGRRKIILDYSRQQVTGETMELLYDLADAVSLVDRREAMRTGVCINCTENRPVLHHVLRMPRGYDFYFPSDAQDLATAASTNQQHFGSAGSSSSLENSNNVLEQVHEVLDKIQDFATKVRQGQITGASGRKLKNVLCIGIGGSSLGSEFVHEALRADRDAERAAQGRTLRFLSNVDPVDFHLCTRDLNPEETLVIVISKTFTTSETMLNARTVKEWLKNHYSQLQNGHNHTPGPSFNVFDEPSIIAHHMVAVTCDGMRQCQNFGIHPSNIFRFWDWVGGRYSVCSAVGVLPLTLQYGFKVIREFLDGAHNIDEHFFDAPLRDNIPVILGLLGVWNSTFLNYPTRALLPYCQALKRFPAHIQQVDMESNGKRVSTDGTPLLHPSGEVTFGEPGTNGQHSFYQLLHQGRVIPADFIGFMESQQPIEVPREAVSNHDELMSNFFAQPDALAYGKTVMDLIQEGVPEALRQHQVFTGNRPSSSILMTKLDAFAVGQLLALYEHRTAVQGFIWGINSFDQYGVELGKHLAKNVRAQLSVSRKTFASVQGFNSSTSSLLDAYLAHGKQRENQR